MKLYEFEGHRVLAKAGIESPFFVVCTNLDEVKQARRRLKFPIVAKVQILSGRRGKAGGVKFFTKEKQLLAFAKGHFDKDFLGETVRFIILSQKVELKKEYYMSIAYDTVKKLPFLIFSFQGGTDIEEIKKKDPQLIKTFDIDPISGPKDRDLAKFFEEDKIVLADFALRLWDAFSRYDLRLIEVNPVGLTADGHLMAIDAKIILDDAGLLRHRDLDILPKGAIFAIPTDREILAKKIDEDDYRGSAGSTFIEFDGDIVVLASGGGASLLVMDSVIDAGGRPANYTEYSGNPPAEKVQKLTKIALDREGLSGCLVAGAVANFTDIYETLRGFVEGLRQVKPKPTYPIVIRRGGPRQEEAYEMLERVGKKEGFDIHLFGPETPISVACQKMVELANDYKIRNPKLESRIDSYH